MMSTFQITGLPHEPFAGWFELTESELAARGALRVVTMAKPGYPCRISLVDADVGDELLLLSYEHQPANSPYRASGPIFVRRHALQRVLEPGEISDYVASRTISLRAYDRDDLIIEADICDGRDVAVRIEHYFGNDAVRYIHLHNAQRGCFSCMVRRA